MITNHQAIGVSIVDNTVGFGRLGSDGELGFRYEFTHDRVFLNERQQCEAVISAHAPSVVQIDATYPISVAGATHVSFGSPVGAEFFVDWHHIGSLKDPGDVTPWINLPPGRYKLTIKISKNDWAHTLWLFKSSPHGPKNRLAVVTVGCYPEDQLASKLRFLFATAAKHGILVNVHGVGEPVGNWFTRKIEKMCEFIASLPDAYDWVIYADGTDCLVMADEQEIVDALRTYGTVCVGAEACPWPRTDEDFVSRFTAPTIHRFPQAGCWGGRRADLLRALWALQEQHYDLKHGIGPSWCFRDGQLIANAWDDQFMWQVAHIAHWHKFFVPDYYWQVIANLTCTNVNPFRTDIFRAYKGRIVTKWATHPVVVHVSGYRKELVGLWFGVLV